jgi:hypothetical protein
MLCMVHGFLLHMKLCSLSGLSLFFVRLVFFLLPLQLVLLFAGQPGRVHLVMNGVWPVAYYVLVVM